MVEREEIFRQYYRAEEGGQKERLPSHPRKGGLGKVGGKLKKTKTQVQWEDRHVHTGSRTGA